MFKLRGSGQPGTVVPAYDPNIQEAKAGRAEVRGQPSLHSEFRTINDGTVRPCLKAKQNKNQSK